MNAGGVWEPPDPTDPAVLADAFTAYPRAAARLAARGERGAKSVTMNVPFLDKRLCDANSLFADMSITALRLLQRAKATGGLERGALADVIAPDEFETVDREARSLVIAGLARIDQGLLRVAPDVVECIPLPLPLLADRIDFITSDQLAVACRSLGVNGGTTKTDRAEAILGVLRDTVRFRHALATAGPEAEALFRRVVGKIVAPGRNFAPVSIYEILTSEERVERVRMSRSGTRAPIDQLCDRLILGSNPHQGYELWLWLEVAQSFGLDVLGAIPVEPSAELVGTDDPSSAPVRVVAALRSVVEFVASNAVEGKKSGDGRPPVRYWRSAAKATGTAPPLAAILGEVAADLGLLYAAELPQRGRGRAAEHPIEWRCNPARTAEFEALGPAAAWLGIVGAWLAGAGASAGDDVEQRVALWAMLAAMPAGTGIARGRFEAVASCRHLHLGSGAEIAAIIDSMVLLGIATAAPGVGLSAAARAASAGVEGVDAVLDGGSHSFVVQPDHTIVAPPDLAPAITAALARVADVVSEGGATVWRLSATRLARIATHSPVESVLDVMRRHASTALPAAVERFVADAMTIASPITVTDAGCVVTSPDAVAIADAARHKAAKLTVMAPGIAVSPLTRAKVASVLAEKGVHLAGLTPSAPSESPTEPGRIVDAARSWQVDQRDPNTPLAPQRAVPLRTESALMLAESMLASPRGAA